MQHKMNQTETTLQSLSSGSRVLVMSVTLENTVRKRLEALGIFPGTELAILSSGGSGVLVAIGESKIALEPEIAAQVQII